MSVIKIALRMAAAAALVVTINSAASAAIYPPQRQLPATVISDFKAAPNSLLQQYPTGGPQLISRVRDLGASDPTTVPGLIALLKDPATTTDQMRAIVAGLAQVARMAAQQDQAYANEIQAAIAGTGNPDVIAAYQAATGDVAIAATGGGAGGGTGAGGPTGNGFPTGGGGGGVVVFGNNTNANNPPNTGGGGVGSAANSVSPVR
ncbi:MULTISPECIES: hypothetical protein [Bradyrhizobium]|uniref:hypothetical protein n=1 Tax=Bradyrhizobium TaxID=374 RepID=UPI00155F2F9C|nr:MULTISPECIES: hypothetical protein [Bradyrhizobium]MDD1519188.1 hypothetical protein [Bradyrhizobium sp. WBAH30]MDD1543432.1 hypothetical protein [Bradyrhizobium sp. WBAH41]MDD1557562.1 hypothetical protein [Bradyrhizobium sp. WBAH23]MDD1564974.1 hypothetical protein [Bradyrhizobium sp. WBAH33]MDD1590382.1 hypothetical protein [Bradyrhizobium sp. WBAH42]